MAKIQQVGVASHDKLRACRHRAFEHPIIIGVAFHDIQSDVGVYTLGELVKAPV